MKRMSAVVMTLLIGFAGQAATACSRNSEDTPESSARSERAAATPGEGQTSLALPERVGDRRKTSGSVPHIQLDAEPVSEVDAELRRRAFLLPGVESKPSGVSLPGAVQLALDGDLDLARPDVIASSKEFAHIHPDGSLHIWLPVELAAEVDEQKWGELHPWVERDDFWDGVVMIYTPETLDELDITIQIIVAAYNFVVGADAKPDDIS